MPACLIFCAKVYMYCILWQKVIATDFCLNNVLTSYLSKHTLPVVLTKNVYVNISLAF